MYERIKKYIEISEVPNYAHKTKKWRIRNKDTGEILGRIEWYGGWRKYVYYNHISEAYCDWDFLRMVADFCEQETKNHYAL